MRLTLHPAVHFRNHDAPVSQPLAAPYRFGATGERYELASPDPRCPRSTAPLRRAARADARVEAGDGGALSHRGEPRLPAEGQLVSPGHFRVDLVARRRRDAGGVDRIVGGARRARPRRRARRRAGAARSPDRRRRHRRGRPVRRRADAGGRSIHHHARRPRRRSRARARRRRRGAHGHRRLPLVHRLGPRHHDQPRRPDAVHGPCARGRVHPAHVRAVRARRTHPQLFSRRAAEGLYHTADATLWFFHAIDRYLAATGDRQTLVALLPTLRAIVEHHLARHALRHRRRSGGRPLAPGGATAISSRGWTRKSTTGSSLRGAARRSRSTRSGTTRCGCCERWLRDSGDSDGAAAHRASRRARAGELQRALLVRRARLALRRRRR